MFKTYAILLGLSLSGCELSFDEQDAPEADAAVTADPPHESIPPECLGSDCVGTIDASIDAEEITHPSFPMPSSCDTCVGFGCNSVCVDAGIDAP